MQVTMSEPRKTALTACDVPDMLGASFGSAPTAHDPRPVYVRIKDSIVDAIVDGEYREGALLPSVRVLAAKSGANPLTAAKAYHYLQACGLIYAERGVGMYVQEGARAHLLAEQKSLFLEQEWPKICHKMARLGINPNDIIDIL